MSACSATRHVGDRFLDRRDGGRGGLLGGHVGGFGGGGFLRGLGQRGGGILDLLFQFLDLLVGLVGGLLGFFVGLGQLGILRRPFRRRLWPAAAFSAAALSGLGRGGQLFVGGGLGVGRRFDGRRLFGERLGRGLLGRRARGDGGGRG